MTVAHTSSVRDLARRHPTTVRVRRVITLLILAASLVVFSSCAADAPDARDPAGVGLAAAPLDLDSVPAAMAGHYEYAAQHLDAYREIPCYCGCDQSIAHRDLADCFVRSDGNGWDAHAAGCGVCIAESALARQLLDDGLTPTAVREAVVDQYQSSLPTTPTPPMN